MSRPRTMDQWMRWVEGRLAALDKARRNLRQAPVGAIVRWPTPAPNPPGWLNADGTGYDTAEYPLLFEILQTNATPNPGGVAATRWIIRAD